MEEIRNIWIIHDPHPFLFLWLFFFFFFFCTTWHSKTFFINFYDLSWSNKSFWSSEPWDKNLLEQIWNWKVFVGRFLFLIYEHIPQHIHQSLNTRYNIVQFDIIIQYSSIKYSGTAGIWPPSARFPPLLDHVLFYILKIISLIRPPPFHAQFFLYIRRS